MLSMLPSLAEIQQSLPVIFVIFFIDGLLSFDNALVLATMVQHLPEKLQKVALRAGLLGAFIMRGLSLCFVGLLIANPWIKLVGAAYLIYLMCSNLGVAEEGEEEQAAGKVVKGLIGTIIAVELADMAFSLDNIIATVAMSPKMWVVCLGVFMSIIVMRFVAGIFIGLVKKFPILEKVSYILVGFIGFQLGAEYIFHFEMTDMQKFLGVLGITVGGIAYERATFLHPVLGPVFTWLGQVMGNVAELVDSLIVPVTYPVKAVIARFSKKAD
jgi:tellurite resistance protein TerC